MLDTWLDDGDACSCSQRGPASEVSFTRSRGDAFLGTKRNGVAGFGGGMGGPNL